MMVNRRWYSLAIVAVIVTGLGSLSAQAQRPGRGEQGREERGRAERGRAERGRSKRPPDKLKVGDMAPDFKLKSLDGKSEVKLSQYRDEKPVALIFGSYT